MRLGTRIFFCFLLIFSICSYYPLNWMLDNLRTRYLEGVEDPLVDQANILAALAGNDMEQGAFDPEKLYDAFQPLRSRQLSVKIYDFLKTRVDMHIYITDSKGIVVFDSANRANIGADYSKWRDVRLTLEGKYGARTTRSDANEPTSSVLHIAAPIFVHGNLAGVLTVSKPTTNINNFIKEAKPQILAKGMISLFSAILLSLLASIWITRPIKRLTLYANNIREGKRARFPKLDRSEIGEMGNAFKKMQEALEGKKYIEHYIQSFTHEVKSPLSAIRGAAELLEEKMNDEQRFRFLSNIQNETNRIQNIVDRMLELSALENLKILQEKENISIYSTVKTVIESKRPMMLKKQVTATVQIQKDIMVQGDSFLLHQAIGNLVQNAIDFSPAYTNMEVSTHIKHKKLQILVDDHGPGVPDYAQEKIFSKFFSLQRPDTGKKSTGLGLNFVKEVAILHSGDISLENRPGGGTRAVLTIPTR